MAYNNEDKHKFGYKNINQRVPKDWLLSSHEDIFLKIYYN